MRRAEVQAAVVRRYTETRYGAKSWGCERRVAARIELHKSQLASDRTSCRSALANQVRLVLPTG